MKSLSIPVSAVLATGFATSAFAGALYPATVDIRQVGTFKSYECGLNGYQAEDASPFATFANCVPVNTFSVSPAADFGNWNVTLDGSALHVNVTGCKQVYMTIVGGVGVHAEYLCPKSP